MRSKSKSYGLVAMAAVLVIVAGVPCRSQADDLPRADSRRLEERITALGRFGTNAMGGVSRIAFSEADIAGREYIKERLKLAKDKGKGWHDYIYMNPKYQKKEPKTSYIEVWDNVIFGAGIYKK